MWSLTFWKSAAERAIRAAASAFLTVIGNQALNIVDLDTAQTVGLMAGAAVASVAMSIVASGVGDKGTPSFVAGGE